MLQNRPVSEGGEILTAKTRPKTGIRVTSVAEALLICQHRPAGKAQRVEVGDNRARQRQGYLLVLNYNFDKGEKVL